MRDHACSRYASFDARQVTRNDHVANWNLSCRVAGADHIVGMTSLFSRPNRWWVLMRATKNTENQSIDSDHIPRALRNAIPLVAMLNRKIGTNRAKSTRRSHANARGPLRSVVWPIRIWRTVIFAVDFLVTLHFPTYVAPDERSLRVTTIDVNVEVAN